MSKLFQPLLLKYPILKHSAVVAWVVLVFITALSWYLSLDLTAGVDNAHRYVTTGILLLTFFKVRLVIIHFMELSNAPRLLHYAYEAWVVIVCGVLIGLYWFAPFS
jgi:hypothetical protein